MIKLTKEEFQELINFANEMPTKYGMALINFLSQKSKEEDEE